MVDRRQMWIEQRELASKLFTVDGAKFKNVPQGEHASRLLAARAELDEIMSLSASSAHPTTSFQPLVIKNGRVVESEGPNWQCFNMRKVSYGPKSGLASSCFQRDVHVVACSK